MQAAPRSLATTWGISVDFFSSGYLDVSVPRTVLQKVRGRAYKALPQLVDTGFQVLFHSPPGVLFTFPSQYYALS